MIKNVVSNKIRLKIKFLTPNSLPHLGTKLIITIITTHIIGWSTIMSFGIFMNTPSRIFLI